MISEAQEMENNIFILPSDLNIRYMSFLRFYFQKIATRNKKKHVQTSCPYHKSFNKQLAMHKILFGIFAQKAEVQMFHFSDFRLKTSILRISCF